MICEPDVLVRTLAPEDWALVMVCSKAGVATRRGHGTVVKGDGYGKKFMILSELSTKSRENYMVTDDQ